ncbi:MAG: ABC transporter substrate-binding protein [Polyangiaceae bacterium]|nr:ABC transporter substrate-binding protein [Polyangiaceae bacterium]
MNHFFAAMISVALMAAAGAASAGAATDVVKAKQATLFDLLRVETPDNRKKIGVIFDEMLDYGKLAEASLGSEWAARTDAEKAEFSDLLKQLVRKAYERNLKKTLSFHIEYVGEDAASDVVVVKTKAVSKTNAREEPIEIAYKLASRDGVWRVHDIVTEGVSLVSSYRSQFTKIVKKDGFPKLIQKMKDKLAKGDV